MYLKKILSDSNKSNLEHYKATGIQGMGDILLLLEIK